MARAQLVVRSARTLLVAGCLVGAAPGGALAVPILDQEFVPAKQPVSFNIGSFNVAQTFVVGVSGLLTGVQVQIARSAVAPRHDLVVDIRRTLLAVPLESSSAVVASATIASLDVPLQSQGSAFLGVDLSSSGLRVTAGEVLAIVLRTGGTADEYLWRGVLDNSLYGAGALFARKPPLIPTWFRFATRDAAFRTFVDPAAVPIPEPSTASLAVLGLVALGAVRRRSLASRRA